MLDGPLVFVDVDTQRDFLDPGGSLYIEGSESIRPNLGRLTYFARETGIPVIATACAHSLDEVDPEPFPPHCLIGTAGADRIEETQWDNGETLAINESLDTRFAERDQLPSHLTLQKRTYDLFSRPESEQVVAVFGRNAPTFVVYGVATDYCVACAVRGLRRLGHRVALVTDAIDAIDRASIPSIFDEFRHLGVNLLTTEAVCQ